MHGRVWPPAPNGIDAVSGSAFRAFNWAEAPPGADRANDGENRPIGLRVARVGSHGSARKALGPAKMGIVQWAVSAADPAQVKIKGEASTGQTPFKELVVAVNMR